MAELHLGVEVCWLLCTISTIVIGVSFNIPGMIILNDMATKFLVSFIVIDDFIVIYLYGILSLWGNFEFLRVISLEKIFGHFVSNF